MKSTAEITIRRKNQTHSARKIGLLDDGQVWISRPLPQAVSWRALRRYVRDDREFGFEYDGFVSPFHGAPHSSKIGICVQTPVINCKCPRPLYIFHRLYTFTIIHVVSFYLMFCSKPPYPSSSSSHLNRSTIQNETTTTERWLRHHNAYIYLPSVHSPAFKQLSHFPAIHTATHPSILPLLPFLKAIIVTNCTRSHSLIHWHPSYQTSSGKLLGTVFPSAFPCHLRSFDTSKPNHFQIAFTFSLRFFYFANVRLRPIDHAWRTMMCLIIIFVCL